MIDFSLTPAQRELQERARDAIGRAVAPVVAELASGEKLGAGQMRRIYRGLAPLGYLGSTISPDDGGAGMSYVDYGLLLEALGASPVLLGEIVPPRTIAHLGSREQKARWLPQLLAGDLVSTAAITEPQAGSDIRNLRTTAIADGGTLRVNGRKKWIKLGGVSDLITVLVVADPSIGAAAGTSRIVLERAVSPWKSRELDSVGIRTLSYAEIEFDDVPVPADNVLGAPGAGTEGFYRGVEASRAIVGLQAIGIAQHAFDIATRYVRQRHAFGRTLARFQSIQAILAQSAAELDAARLLCLRALWLLDRGERCPREASSAKFLATETAVRACDAAMDAMGAAGLAEESGVERCWRDCRMLTVIDGTSGIQRLIVGREILGEPAFV